MISKTVEGYLFEEFKYCQCGCGFTIPKYDKWGRERYFKKAGHVNIGRTGERAPAFKNGRSTNDGYVVILQRDHPYAHKLSGQVREHRLIYEKYMTEKWGIRFIIHPSVECHHINGIITDNRFENLQLMTKAEHASYHNMQDYQERQNRVCAVCGSSETYIKTIRSKRTNKIYTYKEWFQNPLDKTQWVCTKHYHILVRKKKDS